MTFCRCAVICFTVCYPCTCYNDGSKWRNGKEFRAAQLFFEESPGAGYKNDWHFIEVNLALNSIVGGIGQTDGVLQYWFDGTAVHDFTDVVFRTGQHPNMMFNQFVIAPFIGSGSPVDQTVWFDDLIIATADPNP